MRPIATRIFTHTEPEGSQAMPRLNVVDPATATGPVKDIFDGPLKGKHFNIFKGLANSPAALNAYLGLAGALGQGMLTPTEREAIALAVSEANQCDYCVAAHTAIGKGAGLTEDQTLEARKAEFDGDSRMDSLVKFAMLLQEKRGNVSNDDIAEFKAMGFEDGHVAEVVANYALNVFTNYFNHVNESEVDFPAAPPLS
jgi:uncharacterized peroxidase-related enzyme